MRHARWRSFRCRDLLVRAVAAAACLTYVTHPLADEASSSTSTSPIFGIGIPEGYREWQLVAVAHVTEPGPDRLKAILGNPLAIKAMREGTRPLPDGAILTKMAWRAEQHPEELNRTLGEPRAYLPGEPLALQIMVKDSIRYASTGGWGYAEFVNGQPTGESRHRECPACHAAGATIRQDFVFTKTAANFAER